MSNLSELLPAGSGGKSVDFVASGTLPNGKPVVLKSDGTVEVVAPLTISTSIPTGSETTFNTGNTELPVVAFDPINSGKFVIAYKDSGNGERGTAIVGTVSGTSISFGTEVVFNSSSTNWVSISFDPNTSGKFVVAYRDDGNGAHGYIVVGTVSGTSITFGTGVPFNAAVTVDMAVAFDPNTAGKLAVAFKDGGNSNYGKAVVGTVSGTTVSFGSEYAFNSGTTGSISISFDPNTSGKFAVTYRDLSNSGYGTACIGTVSGTAITFGSEYVFNSSGTLYTNAAYDPNNADKFVVVYQDGGGKAIVCTVSGTSISFGSEYAFSNPSTVFTTLAFDSSVTNTFVVSYQGPSGSYSRVRVGTISGTGITFGTEYVMNAASTINPIVATDPNNQGRFIVTYRDGGNSNYGNCRLGQIGYTSTNLTATNFVGITDAAISSGASGSVTVTGGVAANLTGLTIGSTYYVQPAGTLATSAGSPSVVAGKAISATSLILKGNS